MFQIVHPKVRQTEDAEYLKDCTLFGVDHFLKIAQRNLMERQLVVSSCVKIYVNIFIIYFVLPFVLGDSNVFYVFHHWMCVDC